VKKLIAAVRWPNRVAPWLLACVGLLVVVAWHALSHGGARSLARATLFQVAREDPIRRAAVQPRKVLAIPAVLETLGRVVPGSAAHGVVQAPVRGWLEPPETGFPILGEAVRKDQIIGWIVPALDPAVLAQVRLEIIRMTSDIRARTEALEILRSFSWVPLRESKIYQAEVKLAGLREERDILLETLKAREPVLVPIDGVVARTAAIRGAFLGVGQDIIDIADPAAIEIALPADDLRVRQALTGPSVVRAVSDGAPPRMLSLIEVTEPPFPQPRMALLRFAGPASDLAIGQAVGVRIETTTAGLRDRVVVASRMK